MCIAPVRDEFFSEHNDASTDRIYRLCDKTKAKIKELGGRVSHLVALDILHSLYLKDYHKEYPDAKVLGAF